MANVIQHSPDTCKCKRLYQVENGVETPLETYTNKRGETFNTVRCPAHQIADLQEHFNTIVVENQTKNKAMQIAAENDAALAVLNDNGSVSPNLDKLSYSFDQNRKLTIISKDKSVDMAKIQTELDSKLGSGKVSIG